MYIVGKYKYIYIYIYIITVQIRSMYILCIYYSFKIHQMITFLMETKYYFIRK